MAFASLSYPFFNARGIQVSSKMETMSYEHRVGEAILNRPTNDIVSLSWRSRPMCRGRAHKFQFLSRREVRKKQTGTVCPRHVAVCALCTVLDDTILSGQPPT
jgi:hypothetical protein